MGGPEDQESLLLWIFPLISAWIHLHSLWAFISERPMHSCIVDPQLWFRDEVFQGVSLSPSEVWQVSSVSWSGPAKSHSPRKGPREILALPRVPWVKSFSGMAWSGFPQLLGCRWLWVFCHRLAGFPEQCRGFLLRRMFGWWCVCNFFGNVPSCKRLAPERLQVLPWLSAWQVFSVVFCLIFNNTVKWNSRAQICI